MARQRLCVELITDAEQGAQTFIPPKEEPIQPIQHPDHSTFGPAQLLSTSAFPITKLVDKLTKLSAGTIGASEGLEQIVGLNTLTNVSIFDRMARLKKAVCLVRRITGGRGTGFLITDDILLTNQHVLDSKQAAVNAKAKFNYEQDEEGRLVPATEYLLRPDIFFFNFQPLDYALVAVEGSPGVTWGRIPLDQVGEARVDSDAFIIQHPEGLDKKIAMADNEIKFVDTQVIQYLTDTQPGSSGSPVFDEHFNIIALHHKGGLPIDAPTGTPYFVNEGININAIRDHIKANATAGDGTGTLPVWPW